MIKQGKKRKPKNFCLSFSISSSISFSSKANQNKFKFINEISSKNRINKNTYTFPSNIKYINIFYSY
jgi:hypothetical protein